MIEHRIRKLLDAPTSGGAAPALAHLEDTLTAGYAQALALEAERWRVERRIAEVAAVYAEAADAKNVSELTRLARRLKRTSTELGELRLLLASLQQRAAEARAAA